MARARNAITAAIGFVALGFLLFRIATFASLFYEHSGIAISQSEILAAHVAPDPRPRLIPKIIHQVFHNWHNVSMAQDWEDARATCINWNNDWQYILWTEQLSREFIERHYTWFLSTYDSYPYPVQRVDALRLFLLRHYGGIYIDLDNGCQRDLEPLLYYPAFTTYGGHGTISNNILGSTPDHPFFRLLTDSLISYNYNYILPYLTISYASGQWFETAVWQEYHAKYGGDPGNQLYRITMDLRPGSEPWIFFTNGRGGSWNNWDNKIFDYIGNNVLLDSVVACVAALLLGRAVMLCMRRLRSPPSDSSHGELKLVD